LAVVYFLAEVRLATGHQIARRLWAADTPTDRRARAARRALARLERWRIVERQGRRLGGVHGGSGSIVYGVGVSGQRLLRARGYDLTKVRQVSYAYLAHTVAVTELAVRISVADRGGDLELVAPVEVEPRHQFLGIHGTRHTLKPDLGVSVAAGAEHADSWWIEVDLATEWAPAIMRKAERYAACFRTGAGPSKAGAFPRVLFTAPDLGRKVQLQATLSRVRGVPKKLFTVWLFDETVGRLAAEARS
jgi:hypothetical protein